MTPAIAAAHASAQAFINCFIFEVAHSDMLSCDEVPASVLQVFTAANPEQESVKGWLRIKLGRDERRLWAPVSHRGELGQHRYAWPFVFDPYSVTTPQGASAATPEVTLALLLNYLSETGTGQLAADVRERVAQSASVVDTIFKTRWPDLEQIFAEKVDFITTEQSLLAGHPLHPVPKSRVGMRPDDVQLYSPETKGQFRLHLFAADPDIVWQDSAVAASAAEIVKSLFHDDWQSLAAAGRVQEEQILIPVHPLEVHDVYKNEHARELLRSGKLVDLGLMGAAFYPTSSIRTVAHPSEPWMIKLSLGLEITNSCRINRRRELWRAVEGHKLLIESSFAEILKKEAPSLSVITDPAALGVTYNGEVIEELACLFRINPFNASHNVSLLATLTQDHPAGGDGRLKILIDRHAKASRSGMMDAASSWYEQFLAVSIIPLLRVYIRHGLFLEGHQQNLLLELDEAGLPKKTYYRDSQGIFHRDTAHAHMEKFLPGVGEVSESIGTENFADERMGYYLITNTALGMASAIAWQCGVSERELQGSLRSMMESLIPLAREAGVSVIDTLLGLPSLRTKANLRTRMAGMDELIGHPEFQSVYLPRRNPLYSHPQARSTWTFEHKEFGQTYTFRELSIEEDLDLYHRWMNQDYVAKWWDLAKSKDELRLQLKRHQANINHTLYIGMIDGVPMSYWERYWVVGDILGRYAPHETFDQGLHFLVGEPKFRDGHSAIRLCSAFIRLCFEEDARTQRVLIEPDERNVRAHRVFKESGCDFASYVDLPEKRAALMVANRGAHMAAFGGSLHVKR